MGAASKRKGSRGEWRARRLLEAAGYTVIKAGGSLGCFDLVALGAHGIRCIQVKTSSAGRGASPLEREAMRLVALPDHATREVWRFQDYRRGGPMIEVL